MNILILEDDLQRQKYFHHWRLKGHKLTIVDSVGLAISELEEHEFDLLCLDHDLGLAVYVESMGEEETGYLVALWLADNEDRKPKTIVLHSLNTIGRYNMKAVLPEAITYPFVWLKTIEELFHLKQMGMVEEELK